MHAIITYDTTSVPTRCCRGRVLQWWAMVTVTTVGYGDIVPVTPVGKFFASLLMITGVFVVALPISVIGALFVDEYK